MQNEVGLDGIVYSTQGQATLNAVTDVISESAWWFIIVYCFFTVGSVKFLQLFVIFVGEELTAFGFETGEYEKTLGGQTFIVCVSMTPPCSLNRSSTLL